MTTKKTSAILMVLTLTAITPVWADQLMGPEIPISVLDNEQFRPDVAYNNLHDEYLVVWHNSWGANRDIYGQRLDGAGKHLSWFAVEAGGNDCVSPAVAYDDINDRYLVVWSHDFYGDGSDWDIRGRIIPWNGPDPAFTDFNINDAGSHQWVPDVAFAYTHQEYMVVWNNTGAGPIDVSAQRVDTNGATVGSLIGIASGAADRTNPDIAYNLSRNEYLVTYDLAATDILATRLTAGGTILGGGEFVIADWSDPESLPAVASCKGGADQYLVVWHSWATGVQNDVYGRFVDGTGAVGGVVHFANTTGSQKNADVACNARLQEYMVSWEEEFAGGHYGIAGQRLTTDGRLGLPFHIKAPFVGVNSSTPASAAGREAGFIVAWEQDRAAGSTFQDIHGRVVAAPFFADGFESGNVLAWSSASP